MRVAIVLCVLMMAVTALGDSNYDDQEDQQEQFNHLPDRYAHEKLPEHFTQEYYSEPQAHKNFPELYAHKHEPEHQSQEHYLSKHYTQNHLPEHYAQEPLPEHHVRTQFPEHLPEHYAFKHHPTHHAQEHLSEHHAYKHTPKSNTQEHLPDHHEQEELPEELLDHQKHQADYHNKYEAQQPERFYVHHEPAMSYQNFNLHVGPQEVVRIPVHRQQIKQNENAAHGSMPVTYKSHHHP